MHGYIVILSLGTCIFGITTLKASLKAVYIVTYNPGIPASQCNENLIQQYNESIQQFEGNLQRICSKAELNVGNLTLEELSISTIAFEIKYRFVILLSGNGIHAQQELCLNLIQIFHAQKEFMDPFSNISCNGSEQNITRFGINLTEKKYSCPDGLRVINASCIINKCGDATCGTCSHIINGEKITLKNGKTIHPNEDMNCKSKNLIYCLVCSGCSESYIGQTGNSLCERVRIHRQQIRSKETHPNLCIEEALSKNIQVASICQDETVSAKEIYLDPSSFRSKNTNSCTCSVKLEHGSNTDFYNFESKSSVPENLNCEIAIAVDEGLTENIDCRSVSKVYNQSVTLTLKNASDWTNRHCFLLTLPSTVTRNATITARCFDPEKHYATTTTTKLPSSFLPSWSSNATSASSFSITTLLSDEIIKMTATTADTTPIDRTSETESTIQHTTLAFKYNITTLKSSSPSNDMQINVLYVAIPAAVGFVIILIIVTVVVMRCRCSSSKKSDASEMTEIIDKEKVISDWTSNRISSGILKDDVLYVSYSDSDNNQDIGERHVEPKDTMQDTENGQVNLYAVVNKPNQGKDDNSDSHTETKIQTINNTPPIDSYIYSQNDKTREEETIRTSEAIESEVLIEGTKQNNLYSQVNKSLMQQDLRIDRSEQSKSYSEVQNAVRKPKGITIIVNGEVKYT